MMAMLASSVNELLRAVFLLITGENRTFPMTVVGQLELEYNSYRIIWHRIIEQMINMTLFGIPKWNFIYLETREETVV